MAFTTYRGGGIDKAAPPVYKEHLADEDKPMGHTDVLEASGPKPLNLTMPDPTPEELIRRAEAQRQEGRRRPAVVHEPQIGRLTSRESHLRTVETSPPAALAEEAAVRLLERAERGFVALLRAAKRAGLEGVEIEEAEAVLTEAGAIQSEDERYCPLILCDVANGKKLYALDPAICRYLARAAEFYLSTFEAEELPRSLYPTIIAVQAFLRDLETLKIEDPHV